MNERAVKYLLIFLRIGFGALLLASSVHKLADPFSFSIAVKNYDVIGGDLSRWAAVFIPVLEAVTGLLLITGIWAVAASTVNLVLMWSFLLLVVQAFLRGLDISCGCFHMDEGKITVFKLIENGLFALASVYLQILLGKSIIKNDAVPK